MPTSSRSRCTRRTAPALPPAGRPPARRDQPGPELGTRPGRPRRRCARRGRRHRARLAPAGARGRRLGSGGADLRARLRPAARAGGPGARGPARRLPSAGLPAGRRDARAPHASPSCRGCSIPTTSWWPTPRACSRPGCTPAGRPAARSSCCCSSRAPTAPGRRSPARRASCARGCSWRSTAASPSTCLEARSARAAGACARRSTARRCWRRSSGWGSCRCRPTSVAARRPRPLPDGLRRPARLGRGADRRPALHPGAVGALRAPLRGRRRRAAHRPRHVPTGRRRGASSGTASTARPTPSTPDVRARLDAAPRRRPAHRLRRDDRAADGRDPGRSGGAGCRPQPPVRHARVRVPCGRSPADQLPPAALDAAGPGHGLLRRRADARACTPRRSRSATASTPSATRACSCERRRPHRRGGRRRWPAPAALDTAHGVLETPVFMPVGTKGTVKALDPRELDALGRPDRARATPTTCTSARARS